MRHSERSEGEGPGSHLLLLSAPNYREYVILSEAQRVEEPAVAVAFAIAFLSVIPTGNLLFGL
jgi:hypothetical protein